MRTSALVILTSFALAVCVQGDGSPINWFTTSIVSSKNKPAWGRMLPWDKNGDNLITYTQYPANDLPIITVARSNPANPAYTDIATIPSPTNNGDHIQEQSIMVQQADGSIIMACRNRRKDLNWFGLPILKSTDGGYKWHFLSQLDTNPNSTGRFNRGLWEPFLYILPNGCIAGFYANEKHADDTPSFSQIVSERVSCNGGATWGNEIYAAADRTNSASRPGMPGFARMSNGEYILVFEFCGTESCNIYFKTSPDGTSWSQDMGTQIPNQTSGPYVAVLSTGRILVTSDCTNVISYSDDNAQTWNENTVPAFNVHCPNGNTWPAIYQTGRNNGSEVGVVVNTQGSIKIRFGNF